MDLDISPDPRSPLAQQAAEHVRALFAARSGELDDSHQVWNEATSAAVRSLLTPLMSAWNESDAEGAAELVATWAATYLGAYGLVATQLLHTAAVQAWRERKVKSLDVV